MNATENVRTVSANMKKTPKQHLVMTSEGIGGGWVGMEVGVIEGGHDHVAAASAEVKENRLKTCWFMVFRSSLSGGVSCALSEVKSESKLELSASCFCRK